MRRSGVPPPKLNVYLSGLPDREKAVVGHSDVSGEGRPRVAAIPRDRWQRRQAPEGSRVYWGESHKQDTDVLAKLGVLSGW